MLNFMNFDDKNKDELEDVVIEAVEKDEEKSSESKKNNFPAKLPVIPLTKRPFFPGMAAPLVIDQGPYYEVLKALSDKEQKYLGLLLTKDEDQDIYKLNFKDVYKVGVVARILRIIPLETGGAQVILNMEGRFTATSGSKRNKHLIVNAKYPKVTNRKSTPELKAYSISIISTIKELLKLNPLFKEELQIFLGHTDFTEPGKLADFAVALTTASREELQKVLESFQIQKRIDQALILLRKELDLTKLQTSLNQKIETNINKQQREYFLREQLRAIRRELGIEKDERAVDTEKFEERLKQRSVPSDVMETIEEEIDKFNSLDPQSSEYSVCRNYLDWLTLVPWGIYSKERLSLKAAEKILEKEHYGLEDIKSRILEFIGVGKLTGGVRGSILCLVGPPGVGKTSIGKSIAHALDREFYRFSVGGMRDEAEIKGHRRTYIGAMPGKIVQALKVCKTMNPVIMLDEVDKIGSSFNGDPASALLEVLDPEQNNTFLDHYLDVPTDLSDVLFILTANVLENIPEPLKDRMDVLRLSGYISAEKLAIAQKFLIPKNRKKMGLKASEITFSKKGLQHLINGYAREAGVRNLENLIKRVLRKTAVKIVKKAEQRKTKIKKIAATKVTEKNLKEFLGKPIFTSDRFYEKTPIGVAMGLAWTSLGGATLYIETLKVKNEKVAMKLTGQAGEVMKESAQIAWSYTLSSFTQYTGLTEFFKKSEVHIHIPEGATPKDGPSAGITMVTALLSLLMDVTVADDLGMTGELTLTGRVLPIGGVKEKLIAAKRSGLNSIIFPQENERDVDELPAFLKKGLKIHFVEHYDDVFKIAFPQVKKAKGKK